MPVPEPAPGEVLIRIGGGVMAFANGAIPYGASVTEALGGSTQELTEVVALAEASRISKLIRRLPLDAVAEVYRRLQAKEISGSAVIAP